MIHAKIYFLVIKSIELIQEEGFFVFVKRLLLKFGLLQHTNEAANSYSLWITKNEPGPDGLIEQAVESKGFRIRPLVSIITPVYNPERKVFVDMIESVMRQTYDNWELCLANASDDPVIDEFIDDYKRRSNDKIKIKKLPLNKGITGNSKEALMMSGGEFVLMLDHDDLLAPFALFEIVQTINRRPDVDIIYSDRDLISLDGKRENPFFKPGWSPELLLSQNYLCHLNVFRKSLIDEAEGFKEGYEGSQDYDMALRLTELTDRVIHIPKILYHWRIVSGSSSVNPDAKPYAYESAVRAITAALARRGIKGAATHGPASVKGFYDIRLTVEGEPRVAVMIYAKNNIGALKRCINSILSKTKYRNFDINILFTENIKNLCDNDKDRIRLIRFSSELKRSEIYNQAVQGTDADYIIFLDEQAEILSEPMAGEQYVDWLECLLGYAQRGDIGAAGGKIICPDSTIYAAGLLVDKHDIR
ncbi:MAG: glycosyltransferase, partial [Nitrospirae bacterium]|nr:glycosyltransferase [Nitrospirota bacterium]